MHTFIIRAAVVLGASMLSLAAHAAGGDMRSKADTEDERSEPLGPQKPKEEKKPDSKPADRPGLVERVKRWFKGSGKARPAKQPKQSKKPGAWQRFKSWYKNPDPATGFDVLEKLPTPGRRGIKLMPSMKDVTRAARKAAQKERQLRRRTERIANDPDYN